MTTIATTMPAGGQTGAFLSGGGACGALIRGFDWDSSPIGAVVDWPQSLKTALSLMLGAAQPVYVAWGADLISFYNDGYLPIVGDKHPGIGVPFRELWAEIWDQFEPIVSKTMEGESQYFVDLPIALAGRPKVPLGYFTFSYTALRDDEGVIRGFYCAATETTDRVETEQALRAAESRMRAVIDGMNESLAVLDRDFRIVDMNAEAMRMDPRPREELIGKTHWEAHPDAAPELGELYREAMAERAPVSLEHHYEWPDGRETYLAMRAVPIEDGLAVFYRDITGRVQRQRALSESEAKYRSLFESIDEGFCIIEFVEGADGELVDYVHVEANPAYTTNAGIPDVVGQYVRAMVPDEADGWVALYGEVLRTGKPIRFERELVATGRFLELAAFRIEPASKRQVAVLFKDITERKRAEQHQRLLMDELSHRAKNLLAIVQSVAQQSFKGGGSIDDMRAKFEGRLGALAAAHNILTREKWEQAPLGEIVRDTIAALRDDDDRISLNGDDIGIPPKTGVSLAMAIHELATNALKYGSMSSADGRVDVNWRRVGDRFKLEWRETGGPSVSPPRSRGFGTRMIERGLASELDGTVTVDFAPSGVVCRVDAPVPDLTAEQRR